MAWNEPGNNKRRDPWQGGGGDNKADVDAMLKRARDRFGRGFGAGPGGNAWLLVVGVLALWFLFDSWSKINESERGVVLRFGKFHRILNPGLNLKWPTPIERVFVVDAKRVRSTSAQVRMLTKDENIVIVDFNVQYQVDDPQRFQFGVRDPDETLSQAAESAVRQVIGNNSMDVILSSQRTTLSAKAEEILQEMLKRYSTGLVVTELNFQKMRPPQEVEEAFDDVTAAREDKQRFENEARAYSSKIVPEARGQAARIRAEAEGSRASAVAVAEGAAQRFSLLAEQYRAAPDVTRTRLYLETMQDVLKDSPKVMVDGEGDNVMYLPLDKIGATTLPPIAAPAPATDSEVVGTVQAIESARTREGRTGRTAREGRDR